jgi:hypothetical protein
VKPISEEIAELRAMRVPELVERYVVVFGKAPRCKQPTWLWRRIAWKIQEQRFGGLSETAKVRLEELIAEIDLPLGREQRGVLPSKKKKGQALGTTVSRVWKGREVRATAVEGGWEHDGVVYRSLSAVAKAVTGSHWNGRLFFGLTRRAK